MPSAARTREHEFWRFAVMKGDCGMTDQGLALLVTLGIFALMAVWVPFLDFLQRLVRRRRFGAHTPTKSHATLQTASSDAPDTGQADFKAAHEVD
jgi:hypothetical protein